MYKMTYIVICLVAKLCPTHWQPQGLYSPLGFSAQGIFQTRILERVAISFSRGSFLPRDRTRVSCVSCIGDRFFTTEPPRKPHIDSTELKFYSLLPSSWD